MNYRQVYIGGTEKLCLHGNVRKVFSEGGSVIAESCALCGVQMSVIETCLNCTRRGLMRAWKITGKKRQFWCNGTCETKFAEEEKERKREARASK